MLCRMMPRKRTKGKVPVYLNVYDLTPINGYAYWFGLGIYHSGVQVHGVEYSFGAHEYPSTGMFEVEPRSCPSFTFRKSILIGRTDMGPKEVSLFMKNLSEEYSGTTYNLITRNCNHFCNDVCLRLTGKPIPSWVNRLARIGLFCNCILPEGVNETKIQHIRPEDSSTREKKKRRSQEQRGLSPSGTHHHHHSRASDSASRSAKLRSRSSTTPAALEVK